MLGKRKIENEYFAFALEFFCLRTKTLENLRKSVPAFIYNQETSKGKLIPLPYFPIRNYVFLSHIQHCLIGVWVKNLDYNIFLAYSPPIGHACIANVSYLTTRIDYKMYLMGKDF